MKSTKSHEHSVITLSIRLKFKNVLLDYYPAIESPDIRQFIMEKLYDSLSTDGCCLDIRQFLNEIIIILDGDNEECFFSLRQLIQSMQSITALGNQKADQFHWTHYISFVMAVDSGVSSKLTLLKQDRFSPVCNWSGFHADRVSNLTNIMIQGSYPQVLVTHAFYKRLSNKEQPKYTKLYYIRHICCYAEEDE